MASGPACAAALFARADRLAVTVHPCRRRLPEPSSGHARGGVRPVGHRSHRDRSPQRPRRVALVVGTLRRLDVVQELLVDDRSVERAQRPRQLGRAAGVAAGHLACPLALPDADGSALVARGEVLQGRPQVEHRVADATVAPVEDPVAAGTSAHVAGMEVAVHQGVRYPAGGQCREALRQGIDEDVETAPGVVVQLVPGAVDHRLDLRKRRVGALVEHGERLELRHAVRPRGLELDEHPGHGAELVAAGVVLVLARHVGQQHPVETRTQDGGHDAGVEQGHDRRLGGAERGRHLQPDQAHAGREPPDAGEVPGAHLHRRSGQRDVAGGERVHGPVEIALVATGLGVVEAVRMRRAAGCRARHRGVGAPASRPPRPGRRRGRHRGSPCRRAPRGSAAPGPRRPAPSRAPATTSSTSRHHSFSTVNGAAAPSSSPWAVHSTKVTSRPGMPPDRRVRARSPTTRFQEDRPVKGGQARGPALP